MPFDTIIRGGTIATAADTFACDIAIRDGRIVALGHDLGAAETIIDATDRLVLPGGIDSNRKFPIAMTYAGAPQMRIGEDVFLFLVRDPDVASGLTVMGFSQGKYSIVADETGAPAVSRDLTQITLQSPAGTQRGTATRVNLEVFKREIRAYLARR